MTEFAVCAASLCLLLLGTVTISGYQEAQRRTIVAARQAAFEGGWLGDRVSSQSQSSHLATWHFTDAGLVDATGKAQTVDADSVRVTGEVAAVPGQAAIATNVLLTPLRVAGGFLGAGFDLDGQGLRSGTVSAQVRGDNDLPSPFRDLQLGFTQPYALLVDAWNAANPRHVSGRAGGLVPTHALGSLSGLWQGLLAPVSLLEPSLRQLCLGLIEPDRVPDDRLDGGPQARVSC